MVDNIDKKIEAVVGEAIDDAIEKEEPVEIEIVSEEVTVSDEPPVEFAANLAETIEETELQNISSDLMGEYDSDKASREEWEKTYSQGLDLLGFKYMDATRPFRGASTVTHPLLAEGVTQFQAQAEHSFKHKHKELLPSEGPVRTTKWSSKM